MKNGFTKFLFTLLVSLFAVGQVWGDITIQVGNVDAVTDKDSVYDAGYLSDGVTPRLVYIKSNGTYTNTDISNTDGIDVLYGNTSTTSAKMGGTSNLGPKLVSGGKTHLQIAVETGDSVTVYWFHSSTMSNKKMIVSKQDPSDATKGVQVTTVRIDLGTSKRTGCTGWKSTLDETAYFAFDNTLYVYAVKITPKPSAATAPAITAPTADQSASYTIGDVISALEITATGSPAPTYQWYSNSSASTTGATSLGSGAQTASYTPDNSVASDLYYYCVATNSAGSATSPYFHVTVSTPSTPTHDITYTNTKGADNSSNPTEFYEGIGVASFEPLTDVVDFHFTGWSPASIADDATTDQTIDAQWVASYNVTFSAGEGTGAVPDAFQKWEGATFNLPEKGSLTHATKVFDGWKANGTGDKIAAGAEYTMTAAAVEFVAQWKAAPTVLFHWRYDGSTTTLNSELSATGGTVTLKSTDTNNYSAESASYNANVPADMKSTGTKGLKTGKSAQYLEIECTVNFEAGDTIAVTAYGNKDGAGITGWKVSSSDGNTGDIATQTPAGNSNSDYQVGKVVIPSTFVAAKKFYLTRAAGTGTGIAAIKVIRPVKYNVNFAAGEGTGTMTAKAYSATAEVTLPECTFTPPTDKEFDAWTSSDVTISAGKFTMPANDVTITATWKAETPKYDITYYPGTGGSGSIDPAKKTKDVDFVLSSERFTRAGYLQTGWATADGGAKVYELGATYTENADLDLYPFWTELDTYVASFACDDAAPAGWTFSNDGWGDSKATVASVCTFVENSITTPKTTTGDGTSDDDVAFAKNTDAIATYDLGITTTVAALNVVLNGGSSSAFNETIEYLGADGSTVKQSYTNSLSAGNWKDNTISKTDVVADVRYIRVHGASKWVVMKSFSVSYIETRTKYDVNFAAGTGASGTMDALHYIAGAEVTLPACTFTAPTDKEFDAWTSSDVTITDGKFTMPANDVTITATWKDEETRHTVTFETNGGSAIASQNVIENEYPTAVADPTKDNYVFLGWYNNSDLADIHAVPDITAIQITGPMTFYAKWELDVRVAKIVFSNTFDAFIDVDHNVIQAYYMAGTSAPTITSYIGTNLKAFPDGVVISGNKIILVGTDDSEKEYDLTLEAVTPLTTLDAEQTFDGTENYVKSAYGWKGESKGWMFQKVNDADNRETKGLTREYFFFGPAKSASFVWKVSKKNGGDACVAKVYVNGTEVMDAGTANFEVTLNKNTTNMVAIVSQQHNGDCGFASVTLTADYTRACSGNIGTLCVDHNVPAGQLFGATFYQLAGKDPTYGKLVFDEVTELNAGEPYIFQPHASAINLFFGATEEPAPIAVQGMIGSYNDFNLDIDDSNKNNILYIGSNKLYNCSDLVGSHLEVVANRCYIDYSQVNTISSPNPAPGRKRIIMGTEGTSEAMGFEDLKAGEAPMKVMMNGQLYILRGEKIYDATGRLIK